MTPPGADDTLEIPLSHKGRRRPGQYSSLVQVDLGGLSHPGKVRPNNEDHFLVSRFGRFLEVMRTSLPDGSVPPRSEEGGYGMVVADGMGGSVAGEEASRLAITGLVNLVLHTPDWILRLDDEHFTEEILRRSGERLEQVNETLAVEAKEDPRLSGFGTTMTLACSLGRELFVAHLGDSRAYLLRGGRLRQLTRDHTVVQALIDQGVIDRAQAATHRLRHLLSQCLGDHNSRVQPDVMRLTLEGGDRLLLCTDGLTRMLSDEAIGEILAGGEEAQAICQRLVDRAVEAGGKDNVTVAVAKYRLP